MDRLPTEPGGGAVAIEAEEDAETEEEPTSALVPSLLTPAGGFCWSCGGRSLVGSVGKLREERMNHVCFSYNDDAIMKNNAGNDNAMTINP